MQNSCAIIDPQEEIKSVELHKLSQGCYWRFLQATLGAGLNTWRRNTGAVCLAVVASGTQHIVGVFAYENARHLRESTLGTASLLIDCAAPSQRYKHLSKLVVRAAISRETRLLVERCHKSRVNFAVTTAFSQHPESMKYRGLFKLLYREQMADGRYRLRYQGAFTDKLLTVHLAEWSANELARELDKESCAGSVDGGTALPTVGDGSSPFPALHVGANYER